MQVNICCVCIFLFMICEAKAVHYFSIERPMVQYYDSRYVENVVLRSRRVGRQNPVHYFTVEGDILFYAGNNVTVSFYFYEFLTNTYKRSFVELHYKWCDFALQDSIIATVMKMGIKKDLPLCPLQPNHYALKNLRVPPGLMPKNFPYNKGRLYTNVTWTSSNNSIACTSLDFEFKPLFTNLSISDMFK